MRYLLVLLVAVFLSSTVGAQVHVNIGLNIRSQPVWGPAGYDHVDYYYLPDIEVYYNVPMHRYYYNEGGRWISRSTLPSRFRDYDLYNSHKVVINERQPWRNHENYRGQYEQFKGRHDQQPIRDSRDSKYFVNKNHPLHNTWIQRQKHDNGNHFGQNKGNNGKGNNGNGKGNGNGKK